MHTFNHKTNSNTKLTGALRGFTLVSLHATRNFPATGTSTTQGVGSREGRHF